MDVAFVDETLLDALDAGLDISVFDPFDRHMEHSPEIYVRVYI